MHFFKQSSFSQAKLLFLIEAVDDVLVDCN